jgi:hypothetical protein
MTISVIISAPSRIFVCAVLSGTRGSCGLIGARGAGLPLLLLVTACSSDLLTLGKQVTPYHFSSPTLVTELVTTGARNDNPTLTGDLLEIVFTSDRGGNSDVWSAQRASRTDPFDPPTKLAAASSASHETSSAISEDGLALWFASDRPGGLGDLDVWLVTRPNQGGTWFEPTNVASLNSAARDLPRPPGQQDLAMPMASDRTSPGTYRTMMAIRQTTTAEFAVEGTLPDLVGFDGSVDACLTKDGLSLFFVTGPVGDIFVSRRSSVSEPFASAIPVVDLNTAAAERDPWMSPDGSVFYFSSDRSGSVQIYSATVLPPSP